MTFEGKVVFITGGARGIGRDYGNAFAKKGVAVALADIDFDSAHEATEQIRASGARALAVACDVADRTSVQKAVSAANEALGDIDILINNAGKHLLEFAQPITELSVARWQELLAVNIMGVVNCSTACKPSMIQRGGGVIVNISSSAGFTSQNAYGVSKLAVRGLTVALAAELADKGIRVFGLAPGIVDSDSAVEAMEHRREAITARQLIKRPGRMEDLLGPLFLMCSDHASFMTGETILVAGGYPSRL